MKVKECMCGDVCCVKPETKLTEVAKLMEKNRIGCVPVCDSSNYLVGVITDRDIILRSVACDKQAQNTTASEIMTCNVCTCNQDDDVKNADNKVVGILTLGDLAKYSQKTGKENFSNTFEEICDCGHKNNR